MIANGAVAKIVLAVALGGSAGAVSYVTMLHLSSEQAPVTTSAPAAIAVPAVEATKAADTDIEHQPIKRVAKAAPRAHGHRAKRPLVATSACTVKAKTHSKATGACRQQVAAHGRNHPSKVLGYTPAIAVEPRPVQSVEIQHVDKPLPLGSTEIFKAATDAMP